MKTKKFFIVLAAVMITVTAYTQNPGKLVSSKTHIKFFSSTPAEDIEANNYSSVSTINTETGDVVFSVPMQGFEFEKALMQKHFNNEDFLNTSEFPKAKFKGNITNLSEIDFSKDGTYAAQVEGDLTLKGTTKPVKESGSVIVKSSTYEVKSKFNITLADYGITFAKGKPSTNIAQTVEVTVHGEYAAE